MHDERTHTLDEIAKVIGVSRSAVARSIYGSASTRRHAGM
jgi:hypothetical protein